MFAATISLVLLISTAILLYQFWTGALLDDESAQGEVTDLPAPADERRRPAAYHADTAA